MSYQVLARKWRPKNFDELQGQEHVSRALINAIETERLHHAYLFTGTRGVGKTTIARILSKCLNCETNGLTSKPCGECASCVEIDQGRFVDLIEVDAASRTKVDDTRELLENVQYRPTRGRYKVYLIDEVHMLSNSSFNALLKTLEEPPEHVIFLLATTDPQKLPVTVLSRCLQFHLKHMDEQTIANHLSFILGQEAIEFEQPALNLIAQSAEGSMRDALSLLDQAIAFGQGQVQETDIRSMLGTIDHQFMVKLLEALANKDSAAAIQAITDMSNYPVDFADAMKELLSRLHQIAIFQATGVHLDSAATYIPQFAEYMDPQDLQLYYQMGLHARRDMEWAPTPKQGLEMALLRMLAFQLDANESANSVGAKKKVSAKLTIEFAAPEIDSSEDRSLTSHQQQDNPANINAEQKHLDAQSGLVQSNSVQKPQEIDSHLFDENSSNEIIQSDTAHGEAANGEISLEKSNTEQVNQELDEAVGFDEPPFNPDDYQQFVDADETDFEPSESETKTSTYELEPSKQDEQLQDNALASLHSALGLDFSTKKPPQNNAQTESEALSSVSKSDELFETSELRDQKRVSEEMALTESQLSATTHNQESIDHGSVIQAADDVDDEDDDELNDELTQHLMSNLIMAQAEEQDEGQKKEAPIQAVVEEFSAELVNDAQFKPCQESQQWADLVKTLDLTGTYHQILQSSTVQWSSGQQGQGDLVMKVSPDQDIICTDTAKKEIEQALEKHFERNITIEWSFAEPEMETPAMIWQRKAKERHRQACNDLIAHPFAKQLQSKFAAQLDEASIKYLTQ
ncbi:MAG: DNA polymerase III subunit gamma/tau [Kangiellaceae bacterium]|nr:DNA polymerase III subunit gamma/tau [Kangiellaceae bacterium]